MCVRVIRPFILVCLLLTSVALLVSSCGGGGGNSTPGTPSPTNTLVSLGLSPSAPALPLGLTQQLTATGTYSNGSRLDLTTSTSWSSSAPTVATISAQGLITTLATGSTTITGTSGTTSATVTVTVTDPVVTSINVTPTNPSITLGQTIQLTASALLSNKTTSSSAPIAWSSSDTTVAAVDSQGVLTPNKGGTVTISATSGSVTGKTSITVSPLKLVSLAVTQVPSPITAGYSKQLTAVGTMDDGSTQSLKYLTWTSSDPSLATVDSLGLVTTHLEGAVTISAKTGSISGSTSIAIDPPIVTTITLSQASLDVQLGADPIHISAKGIYSNGITNDVTDKVAWSSFNPYVGTVDASGNVTPARAGYTNITAALDKASASVDVAVRSTPRYMYMANERATIDASTGQVTLLGKWNIVETFFANCTTLSPSGEQLYRSLMMPPDADHADYWGRVDQYSIEPQSGDLTSIGSVATSLPVGCVNFEPAGLFAFASMSANGTGDLLTFTRDASTGKLSIKNTLPLPTGVGGVSLDPLGQFIYLADPLTGTVYGYTVDVSTGALQAVAGTPFTLSNATGMFSFHPAGKYVYMSNSNGNSIDLYTIDRSSGRLTPVSGARVSPCINPSRLRFSPDGHYAYGACSLNNDYTGSGSVQSFAVNGDGTLTGIGSNRFDGLSEFTLDPSGKFLYAYAMAGYMGEFSIGDDHVAKQTGKRTMSRNGEAMVILGGTAPLQKTPNYAFISTSDDNKLWSFPIQSDGSFGVGTSYFSGLSPNSIAVTTWGSQLLLSSKNPSPNVQSYTMNRNTGALSPGLAFGSATEPGSVLIDASGYFALETDALSDSITEYSMWGGSWGPVWFAPADGPMYNKIPAGSAPGPMAMDPSRTYLYVANQGSNTISVYTLEGFGGSPQPLQFQTPVPPYKDASPFPTYSKPVAMTMDPTGLYLYVLTADQNLRVYSIDMGANGHISLVSTVALGAQPYGVSVEARNRYVYVATSTGVQAFHVDLYTGATTGVSGGTVSIANVNGVHVDPSDKYLYVTTVGNSGRPSSAGSGAVYLYLIQSDGTLQPGATNPMVTLGEPSAFGAMGTIN